MKKNRRSISTGKPDVIGKSTVRSTPGPHQASATALPTYNRPYWIRLASGRRCPVLMGESRADVAVIGAGITGLTAGLILQRAGRSTAVVEMSVFGWTKET